MSSGSGVPRRDGRGRWRCSHSHSQPHVGEEGLQESARAPSEGPQARGLDNRKLLSPPQRRG